MSAQILNHFDVANLLGHAAFEHFSSAIAVHFEIKRSKYVEPSAFTWQECLRISVELSDLRAQERKSCVQAVVLFQAMMEKIPYFVRTLGSGLTATSSQNFRDSWMELISQIEDSETRSKAETSFNGYKTACYDLYRNAVIHGRSNQDIQHVSDIRVSRLFVGIRDGWKAFDFLLAEAFSPDQRHEPSWENMCEIHSIPVSIDSGECFDIDQLEREFSKRHLAGARGEL